MLLLLIFLAILNFVTARHCEGGHICSLPRECCTQGCCPPYQSGPRQLPPPSEHVLNLFFISHWFFWCVVVAIILAILCAYSLWKKRRTLCGWGFAEHHIQSEGDSAGSCYVPPQYSRCNSFHHPPPPYTEVTSKPDLYPLVFTCNGDNGKSGSSYLMVQYFRNYIVRPVGSLSAASTVDSLSSSFICNNEANTLVPPPYSRAASPDIGFTSHFQQHYIMPRSASQLVCANNSQINGPCTTVTIAGASSAVTNSPRINNITSAESGSVQNAIVSENTQSHNLSLNNSNESQSRNLRRDEPHKRFIQSQSDQQFRYLGNSNSSISDIFVNNSTPVPSLLNSQATAALNGPIGLQNLNYSGDSSLAASANESLVAGQAQQRGASAALSNCSVRGSPLIRNNTTSSQMFNMKNRDTIYNSCNSIEGAAVGFPSINDGNNAEFRDIHLFRRSLETCCQILQNQQNQMPLLSLNDSSIRIQGLIKKYTEEGLRSYVTSGTVSGVSSLTNIGTPSSPPQATSPTGEVKEILDQIRQLQIGVSFEELASSSSPSDQTSTITARPSLQHTMSSPSPTSLKCNSSDSNVVLQRFATMPEQIETVLASNTDTSSISPTNVSNSSGQRLTSSNKLISSITKKRPATLQKKFYSSKPNKTLYIPMVVSGNSPSDSPNISRSVLKSPASSMVGSNFFSNRSRFRKGWISRSAPTTPGTGLPPSRLGDDSPLLNEHDEDTEGEQFAEIE